MSKRCPTGLSLYAGASPIGVDRVMRGSVAQAVRRFHEVKESAPAVERTAVREATYGGFTTSGPGRMLLRLIAAGWSLNGNYYPAEVLRRDGPSAWEAGTRCYVDHASDEEEQSHPSGSVKNLAAVLTQDAYWDEPTQSLVAEARLFEPWRGPLTQMAEAKAIGMSIRAWVTGAEGAREGREGYVVDWVEGRSVDFVTVPAAGGEVISVLEAVGNPVAEAANLGAWLESRLHLALTTYADEMYGDGRLTRDERITLSGAIGDGLQAYTARIEADAPQLYQRDRYSEPEPEAPAMAATGSVEPVAEPEMSAEALTEPEPVAPAATPTVTDGTPPPASAPPITTIKEEPVSGIQTGAPPEQAGTASVPDNGPAPATPAVESTPAVPSGEAFAAAVTAAVEAAMKPMTSQLAEFAARETARDAEGRALRHRQTASEAVTVALRAEEHTDVADSIAGRVTTRVVADVPTTAEGAVDDAKLAESITAVIADEATHVRRERANALAEAGVGLPYGVGASAAQESTDDGLDGELESLFSESLGLSSEAAKIAARGRG